MSNKNLKHSAKLGEIIQIVSRLFASKGYHSTSMREIAQEAGMRKSSLYHYFESKEDALFIIMNHAMDEALVRLEEIFAKDLPPEDKLKQVLTYYSTYYVRNKEGLVLLVNDIGSLTENHRRILIEKERHYLRLMKMVFEELRQSEKMIDIPYSIATFSFFGMVHYTITWYRQDGPVNVDQLSEYFVNIFTKGVLKSEHCQDQ